MQYGVQDERDSQRGHRFHPFGPVVTAAARATLFQPPSVCYIQKLRDVRAVRCVQLYCAPLRLA